MKFNIVGKARNPEAIKGAIGIVLILLSLGGIFYWENYGREEFTYQEVIVLNQNVEKGTKIELDMLGKMRYDRNTIIDGCLINAGDVVGKTAKGYIPKGIQLTGKFFESSGLVLKEGEYIFQLPREWVYGFPQTIRRGDTVYFYPVQNIADIDTFVEGKDGVQVERGERAVLEAKVMFVKDSANREVVDVTAERIDASAIVSSIELIFNDAKNTRVRELAEQGYQFILAYE